VPQVNAPRASTRVKLNNFQVLSGFSGAIISVETPGTEIAFYGPEISAGLYTGGFLRTLLNWDDDRIVQAESG